MLWKLRGRSLATCTAVALSVRSCWWFPLAPTLTCRFPLGQQRWPGLGRKASTASRDPLPQRKQPRALLVSLCVLAPALGNAGWRVGVYWLES